MKATRLLVGVLGLIAVAVAFWQIQSAASGLKEIHSSSGGVPMVFVAQPDAMNGNRPLVLVAHGFAGSGTIMRGFAYTLASAGYVVALWDFDGHAANPNPMPANTQSTALLRNSESALAEAGRLGLADVSRVAILGHSMGSGVALTFGQQHADTSATIAVSPVGTSVTPALPRNLLLMAGSLEASFAASAEKRLAEAGGPGGDSARGTARKLVIVPNVEHITILFSTLAHTAALDWLNSAFGPQPKATPYEDRRLLWFAIGILGTLLASATLLPRPPLPAVSPAPMRPLWRRLLALVAGALAAALALWLASKLGLELGALLRLRSGGYLIAWFALAGSIGLLLLGSRFTIPTRGQALTGMLIFAALWLGIGLLGHFVFLPWLLIPIRMVIWPVAAVALLPWCLLLGELSRDAGPWRRLGWWLAQSVVLFGVITLAIRLSPELSFLSLLLPVFPIVLLFQALPNLPQKGAWSFAVSGPLFVGWMLVAVFPMV